MSIKESMKPLHKRLQGSLLSVWKHLFKNVFLAQLKSNPCPRWNTVKSLKIRLADSSSYFHTFLFVHVQQRNKERTVVISNVQNKCYRPLRHQTNVCIYFSTRLLLFPYLLENLNITHNPRLLSPTRTKTQIWAAWLLPADWILHVWPGTRSWINVFFWALIEQCGCYWTIPSNAN